LQFFEQVDDLRLNGHVEGADWFVADDKIGLNGNARHTIRWR
jgi:hypothetical protein